MGFVIFMLKASVLVCVQIWIRWTLPRLRIDQVMTTCLKYLIPISCFVFAGTVAYPLVLVTMTGQTSILGPKSAGERLVVPGAGKPLTRSASEGKPLTRSISESERFTALHNETSPPSVRPRSRVGLVSAERGDQ